MPNHTATILEIRGDKKLLQAFVAAIKTGKKIEHEWTGEEVDEYEFDLLLPVPKELVRTMSPSTIVSEEEYLMAVEDDKDSSQENTIGLPLTQAMSEDYKKRFGHDNWYAWRNANYGTKWGMYSVEFSGFATHDTIAFTYNTAWSPATKYFVNISPQFPSLSFRHMFADEGGGFLGYEVIKNGKMEEAVELDWNSERGIALREDLGCYCPEDEEEEAVGILESIGK